jgi:ABC-type dipeptide/oligopeptide/nickel transport system permease subunit
VKSVAQGPEVPLTTAPRQVNAPRRTRNGLRLLQDPLTLIGLAILITYVTLAVAAPLLGLPDPRENSLGQMMQPPSWEAPFGTDHLGRSLLARVVYGARISLSIAGLALLVLLLIGVTVGAIAGYYGGWLDVLLMRLVDVLLAFPGLVLVLAIAGMLGPSLLNILIAMVAVEWVKYARVVRGQVLSVREMEFVEGARATGVPGLRIIWRHILPNVISPVIIMATLDLGAIILGVSALSFLGLGAQAPTPEWGRMLSDATPYMQFAPHLMIVPGLAIFTVVLACNLLGDGLRDALDPKGVTRKL